ncbi:MAG TPA: TIGR01212 family radical SAM protein [Bacteroidales bacterium]|nr:TIGR01212 family radical SAM protein [Bacteroidales bacterium]
MSPKQTYPWGHDRPINLASNFTKKEFGGRAQKVTLDAGFTCPNRDGTVSSGGCTFCNNNAFNPSYCAPEKSITEQINQGINFHKKRYRKATHYIAYFQAYSNTYAPVDILRERYFEALQHELIDGIVIGTRPDCVNNEVFSLLEEINKKYYLIVEYGVESVYDNTLKTINRGHSFETSKRAIEQTAAKDISCGAHFIFGLPGETKEMMLNAASIISELPLNTVKFHQLQVVKNTKIGRQFKENPLLFKQFELEEYIGFIIEFLSRLSPRLIIERLAGESQPEYNLSKKWNVRYDQVLRQIEKNMIDSNTWQGKFYKKQV